MKDLSSQAVLSVFRCDGSAIVSSFFWEFTDRLSASDDNFASIEAAVEEGCTVYGNLLKTIGLILPVNGGEAMTIVVGILAGTTLPILPVQILWVNMVSSVALSATLAFEPL